jgi:UDP-N-acetylmuramate dehydrogenase
VAATAEEIPHYPGGEGRLKMSAAWLIERAGFRRGYSRGTVGLSEKHTLAIVNRGGATAADVVGLAREVRDGVRDRFGVCLHAEPVFVGVSLD